MNDREKSASCLVGDYRERLLSLGPQLINLQPKCTLTTAISGTADVEEYLAVSRLVAEQLSPIAGYWPITPPELHVIAAAVFWHNPHVIFDWGTNVGNSARVFWWSARAFGRNTDVHTIDLPLDVAHPENIKENRAVLVSGTDVQCHFGDGVTVAVDILKSMAANTRALFYVDGDHWQPTVERELHMIRDASPSAVIILDDCHPSGPVISTVKEFVAANPTYGMHQTLGHPGKALLYPMSPS